MDLGGTPRQKRSIAVGGGVLRAPLVEREGRIGDHHVEGHQAVAFDQGRAVEGVAPFDARGVLGVQEHVHARQRPGGAVHLLAVQGEVVGADFLGGADQQRAGAAGRVADGVAGLRRRQLRQQPGDRSGGVELTGFLAGVGGEAGNEVDVALADNVAAHLGRAQVEGGFGEVFQEVPEAAIAVLGAAEVGLGVEVDVAEHAVELGAVGVFDGRQRPVDALADVGLVALFVEVVEARPHRQDEALALQPAADARLVASEPLPVGGNVVVPQVGDVLQKQHHQDVVLVLAGIHDAAEGVAGGPRRLVHLGLCDAIRHGVFLYPTTDATRSGVLSLQADCREAFFPSEAVPRQ